MKLIPTLSIILLLVRDTLELSTKTFRALSTSMNAPLIVTPPIPSVGTPSSNTGLTFSRQSGTFQVNVGAVPPVVMNLTGSSVVSMAVDNLVANSYSLPSTPFSERMGTITPPPYEIFPCPPSTGTSNAGCLPGSSAYNIQLPNPLPAATLVRTAV